MEPKLTIVEITRRDHEKGDYDEDNFAPARPHNARVYFWPEGETFLENFFVGRRTRPVGALKKLLPEVFKQQGLPEHPAEWSQYAGCTCGCSPGFVVTGLYGFDLYVTYKIEQAQEGQVDDASRAG